MNYYNKWLLGVRDFYAGELKSVQSMPNASLRQYLTKCFEAKIADAQLKLTAYERQHGTL